jgi:hypothetical protein
MQGILQAYADGARIIQVAYSSIGGWPEDPVSQVVDRLAAEGALVVATVGDQPQGAFYVNRCVSSVTGNKADKLAVRRQPIRRFLSEASNQRELVLLLCFDL